jgi:hypothetical protein
MSNFLKIIQEATPATDTAPVDDVKVEPNSPVKKGGFLQKAAAGAAKATAMIQKGEQISQGKWDIAGALQKILDRQLDNSTDKVGKFGKDGFKKVRLGSDIVDAINKYIPKSSDTEPVESDTSTDEVRESYRINSNFLRRITEVTAVMTPDPEDGKYKTAHKSKKPVVERVYDILKTFDLEPPINFKVKNVNGKKDDDQRIKWITKGASSFLSGVKELYPDFKFTFSKDPGKLSVGMGSQNDEPSEDNEAAVAKRLGFKTGREFRAAAKEAGGPAKYFEQNPDKAELVRWDSSKSNVDNFNQYTIGDIPDEDKEPDLPEDFQGTSKSDFMKSIGRENIETLVRAMVDIYPNENIRFPDDDPDTEDGPDGPGPDETPDPGITEDIALFELAKPNGYGQKGTQYTLKPLTPELGNMLKQKDIKYLTYLNQTPQNEFKVPESNVGIIYAYDNNNEVINAITTELARFQWNGQDKLYTISTANKELVGVSYSEGQFPIKEVDAAFIDPAGKYLIYKDKKSGNLAKWPIVTQKSRDGTYTVNKNKPQPITEKDKNDVIGADASTTTPPVSADDAATTTPPISGAA